MKTGLFHQSVQGIPLKAMLTKRQNSERNKIPERKKNDNNIQEDETTDLQRAIKNVYWQSIMDGPLLEFRGSISCTMLWQKKDHHPLAENLRKNSLLL